MDANRFDQFSRSLTSAPSRRTMLGLALGGGFASLLGLADAGAKKKKGKKKKKKCKGGTKKCGKKCIPAAECCGACTGGKSCLSGSCACPDGQKDCAGTCIPGLSCCTSADCGTGNICAQNECVTGQGTCQAGGDICVNDVTGECGTDEFGCFCFQSTEGETRCGTDTTTGFVCGNCQDSADCATLFPGVPGVFCAHGAGGDCCGVVDEGFCQAPCPV